MTAVTSTSWFWQLDKSRHVTKRQEDVKRATQNDRPVCKYYERASRAKSFARPVYEDSKRAPRKMLGMFEKIRGRKEKTFETTSTRPQKRMKNTSTTRFSMFPTETNMKEACSDLWTTRKTRIDEEFYIFTTFTLYIYFYTTFLSRLYCTYAFIPHFTSIYPIFISIYKKYGVTVRRKRPHSVERARSTRVRKQDKGKTFHQRFPFVCSNSGNKYDESRSLVPTVREYSRSEFLSFKRYIIFPLYVS